ncbi:MAG: hypothetical protein IPH45_16005 [Bacteroidales bacterium]|nr:hypothetical protein [Bacteroidales bacterium]
MVAASTLRLAKPFIGPSFYFSFNHPEGMCPFCHGLGKEVKIDLDQFLEKDKTLREGVTHPHYKVVAFSQELISLNLFPNDLKLSDFPDEELNKLLYSEPFAIKDAKSVLTYQRNFEGIARKLEKSITAKAEDEVAEEEKNAYTRLFCIH